MELIIRKALQSDASRLAVLKQQVWISTYATGGISDVFAKYVQSEYSLAKVSEALADNEILILLACDNGCLVGCAELRLVLERPADSVAAGYEITTLYILENFQGQGIGKQLLSECIRQVKMLGGSNVWLTVYYNNPKAIEFYRRQRFSYVGDADFILKGERHKNYIMQKEMD